MKIQSKLKAFLIIFFIAIFAVIIARYFIGLHFKKKFSIRPAPGVIVSKVENLKKLEKIKIPVVDKIDEIKVQKDKEENKTKKISSKKSIRSPRTLWVRRKKRAV